MNKSQARKIAEKITNQELLEMFENAKTGIKDWSKVSICNKSFSKGTAWNILTKGFDVNNRIHILGKTNMIREFGAFLPDHLKPKRIKKPKSPYLHDQKPNFEQIENKLPTSTEQRL